MGKKGCRRGRNWRHREAFTETRKRGPLNVYRRDHILGHSSSVSAHQNGGSRLRDKCGGRHLKKFKQTWPHTLMWPGKNSSLSLNSRGRRDPARKHNRGPGTAEGGGPQPPPRSAGATSGSGSTWTGGSGALRDTSSAESSPQLPSKGSLPGDVAEHRVVADLVVERGALVPIHGPLGQEPNLLSGSAAGSGSGSAAECH